MYLKTLTENENLTLSRTARKMMNRALERDNENGGIESTPSSEYQRDIALKMTEPVEPDVLPVKTFEKLTLADLAARIQASEKYLDDLFLQTIGALVSLKLGNDRDLGKTVLSKDTLVDAIVEVLKLMPPVSEEDIDAFMHFKKQVIMPITTGAYTVYKSMADHDQFLDLQRWLVKCRFQSKLDQLLWPRVLLGVTSDVDDAIAVEDIPEGLWIYGEEAEDELIDLVDEIVMDFADVEVQVEDLDYDKYPEVEPDEAEEDGIDYDEINS